MTRVFTYVRVLLKYPSVFPHASAYFHAIATWGIKTLRDLSSLLLIVARRKTGGGLYSRRLIHCCRRWKGQCRPKKLARFLRFRLTIPLFAWRLCTPAPSFPHHSQQLAYPLPMSHDSSSTIRHIYAHTSSILRNTQAGTFFKAFQPLPCHSALLFAFYPNTYFKSRQRKEMGMEGQRASC
jgi:hypothetical protein